MKFLCLGEKTAAQLEAEMMDRALKESLDLAANRPVCPSDSFDEGKMLERALKESLATASKAKVRDAGCEQFQALGSNHTKRGAASRWGRGAPTYEAGAFRRK